MAPEVNVNVRPWHRRRDRAAIERWPAADLPQHWTVSEPDTGQRESWAIDYAGQLAGRITLRAFAHNELHDRNMARMGIYLRPGLYGQGIGTAALTRFIAISPVGYLRLDVASDNHRAIQCYRRAGFRVFCWLWNRRPVAFIEMDRLINASDRATAHSTVCGAAH